MLVFLILFQGIGWLLAWQAIQWQAKYAAQSALFQEDAPIRTITLQQDFFQKIKVGKREILLDGNLYDIRSSEVAGDSVKLEVYHDWYEQALYTILGTHFSRLDNSDESVPKPLSMWVAQSLGSAFVLPDTLQLPFAKTGCNPVFLPWTFAYPCGLRPPPFIPPRIVFETV